MLDDKRSCTASNVAEGRSKRAADEPMAEPATPQASDVTGQRSESSAAPPTLPSVPPQMVANSPCVTKEDLREFVSAQSNAVSAALSLNRAAPGKDKCARVAYKWPTKSHGSQVGSSLTKLTGDEYGGQQACGSAFRIAKTRP